MNASIAYSRSVRCTYTPGMTTELWQRLAAARRHGKKTQADIAAAITAELGRPLTRNAVSLWESSNPETRTTPSVEQLRVVASETGTPLMWLMEDAETLDIKPISIRGETFGNPSVTAREPRVQVRGTAYMDKAGFWTELVDDPEGNGYFSIVTDDPAAYAVRIRGTMDAPLAMSGWYLVLVPSLVPDVGTQVLVRLKDGRSTLKEFLWHRDGEYALQAADGSRMVLPEAEVDHVHSMAGAMMPNQLKR